MKFVEAFLAGSGLYFWIRAIIELVQIGRGKSC